MVALCVKAPLSLALLHELPHSLDADKCPCFCTFLVPTVSGSSVCTDSPLAYPCTDRHTASTLISALVNFVPSDPHGSCLRWLLSVIYICDSLFLLRGLKTKPNEVSYLLVRAVVTLPALLSRCLVHAVVLDQSTSGFTDFVLNLQLQFKLRQ